MQTDLGQTGTPQITTILTSFLISDDISLQSLSTLGNCSNMLEPSSMGGKGPTKSRFELCGTILARLDRTKTQTVYTECSASFMPCKVDETQSPSWMSSTSEQHGTASLMGSCLDTVRTMPPKFTKAPDDELSAARPARPAVTASRPARHSTRVQ